MRKLLTALAPVALLTFASPVMADSEVSCTRDTVLAGAGTFNFTCKETPGQNYCIPYAATRAVLPKGGADAINAWVAVVNGHTSLTFHTYVDGSFVPLCLLPDSLLVRGVGSNN